jgi:pseudouridine-5'-phosphate glycosidase
VALESTVITHGLPHPENLQLARDMEAEVSTGGAQPATVAVLDGQVCVGMSAEQLGRLAVAPDRRKISVRDFGLAVAAGATGGTTVAGTLFAAHQAGICTFATGGIGGVHRQPPHDVSADLPQLAKTPAVVVCAGAKAILDLPATVEYLETAGVPVIGYQTDTFPAFYMRDSGLPVSWRLDTPEGVAAAAQAHWKLGFTSAVLVVVPPPAEHALQNEQVLPAIDQALAEAESQGLRGQAVTPYLLGRLGEITGGATLGANLALLRNNARVAAQIAHHLPTPMRRMVV